jgi:glycerol-3-phosphate cytidylyltransferase
MVIGFTCGAFDLLHAGHVIFLKECRQLCDHLMVGLHTDPTVDRSYKNKPAQSVFERYLQLSGCKYVNDIVPYETERDLEDLLGALNIQKRFLGSDYAGLSYSGEFICKFRSIEIVMIPRLHSWSSSALRDKIKK